MSTYELVQAGKVNQKISSDRGFALRNGLTAQNITDWKSGKAMPSLPNLYKLAKAAGLTMSEAITYLEEDIQKKCILC